MDHPLEALGARASARVPRALSSRSESGAVTAEAAAVLPVLLALALGLVWVVSLGAAQVRVVDAAREAVRVAARGEDRAAARAAGARVAPDGAAFTVTTGPETVRVRAVAEVDGPGGLFAWLPGVRVTSEAVALREPSQ